MPEKPRGRPLRLLHVHSSFDPGGKELRTVQLINRFGKGVMHTIASAVPGATGPLTPGTAVVVYDTTAGRAVTKLGNVQVDNLGNWSLKLRPGPRSQVGQVLVQSTRGGTAESAVTP